MIKLKRLDAKGIAHHVFITGVVVVLVIGSIGAYVINSSKAENTHHCYFYKGDVHYSPNAGDFPLTYTKTSVVFGSKVEKIDIHWGDGESTGPHKGNDFLGQIHYYWKSPKQTQTRYIKFSVLCKYNDKSEFRWSDKVYKIVVPKCEAKANNPDKCKGS